MEFKEFRSMISDRFNEMTKNVDRLFEVGIDKDEMWNVYLDSFPDGTNEIYRKEENMTVVVADNLLNKLAML